LNGLKKLIATLLAVVTIWSIHTAYVRGKANIYYFRAESRLNQWAKNDKIKDKEDYQKALYSITLAHQLDPGHPHYVHILGRIIQWGIDFGFDSDSKLPQVKQYFLSSTKLRPLWPDPWIDLALLNDSLEGYTPETVHYRDQALKTGPYWDTVTSGVIKLLLKHWDVLSNSDKALLNKELKITLKRNALLEDAFYFSNQYHQVKRVCNILKSLLLINEQSENFIVKRNCAIEEK